MSNMAETLYLVTAFRWGNVEEHSYTCGVFDNLDVARAIALRERIWRGGKYEMHIEEVTLNNAYTMTCKHVNNFWWIDPREFTQEEVERAYADVESRMAQSSINEE